MRGSAQPGSKAGLTPAIDKIIRDFMINIVSGNRYALLPALNTHVPQDKGTYVANEKRELSTLRILFFMGKDGDSALLQVE
jgi:hypothetical protein